MCARKFSKGPTLAPSAETPTYYQKALQRTPNRPKAIFGLARCAQILGDKATARRRYQEFRTLWNTADSDRPELVQAKAFLAAP